LPRARQKSLITHYHSDNPRFPRGWIFLWISSSIKFYIREWKEEFFTSFLFYTHTHRKKSLMRPFFFFFFFFPFGVVMGELLFAGMRLLLLRRENVYEKSWQKSWIESQMFKRDAKERCWVSFWKKEEWGVFFFQHSQ
jgi:hypothetical protein